jgi:hypothetical protein
MPPALVNFKPIEALEGHELAAGMDGSHALPEPRH